MRTMFCAMLLGITLAFGSAYSQHQTGAPPRSIDVTGSAIIEVVPDTYKLSITLREYFEEEFQKGTTHKDYKTKVRMPQIAARFLAEIQRLGVAPDDLQVEACGAAWRAWGRDFQLSNRYTLVTQNAEHIDSILSGLSVRGIQAIDVRLEHSNIRDYRKQVKEQALLAAKAKAAELLGCIGEKAGAVQSIREVNNDEQGGHPYHQSGLTNVLLASGAGEENNARTIRLRYEVQAVFAIE